MFFFRQKDLGDGGLKNSEESDFLGIKKDENFVNMSKHFLFAAALVVYKDKYAAYELSKKNIFFKTKNATYERLKI